VEDTGEVVGEVGQDEATEENRLQLHVVPDDSRKRKGAEPRMLSKVAPPARVLQLSFLALEITVV
jgi:hypothetical protein